MRKSKKKTVDNHFAKRCMQRLGYIPNRKELINKIQTGKLEFNERQSNRVTTFKWKEPIKNIDTILVYDKLRKQLITILFEKEDGDDYILL